MLHKKQTDKQTDKFEHPTHADRQSAWVTTVTCHCRAKPESWCCSSRYHFRPLDHLTTICLVCTHSQSHTTLALSFPTKYMFLMLYTHHKRLECISSAVWDFFSVRYLTEMNDPVSASTSWSHLRSTARGDLAVPHSRTTTYRQRRFSVSGPSNSLLLSVRDPSLTMKQFCTHLKTFLFRRAYCT